MSEKKKVIVFTTGGTIAMKFDPKVNGLVPAVSGAEDVYKRQGRP